LSAARQALETLDFGQVFEETVRLRHANGAYKWIRMREMIYVRDDDGRPLEILGVAQDVTRQKIAEEALRQSELRFRRMAENIRAVFWVCQVEDMRMVYVSPAYEQIWGRPIEALKEDPLDWLEAVHEEDRKEVAWAFLNSAARGSYDMEYRLLRPNGVVRWVHDRGFPIRDAATDEVKQIVGITEDVTDLKEAQDRSLQSARLAAVGQTVAGLAHESRNALQRAAACVELLALRLEDKQRELELINDIRGAVRELRRLFDEVRAYASPIRLDVQACDAGVVLRRAWEHLSPARENRHAVVREVFRGVPQEGGPDLYCEADPQALEQVFRNILENALAACSDPVEIEIGWSPTRISTSPHSAGRPGLRISIHDNGPGLSPEARLRVFEPFFTTKTQGTGLGMAIVRRIVEAHQGTIEIGPDDGGVGAEVSITLPRKRP
ncbi:MAG: PAS domain-containing protein, partial [Planctomycetia bacterium]